MDRKAACCVRIAGLRKEPSHRAEQLTQLLLNDRVLVLDEQGAWARVQCRMNGTGGWVLASQLAELDDEQYQAEPLAISYVGNAMAGQWPDGIPGTYYFKGDLLPAGAKSLNSIQFKAEVVREIVTHYLDVPYQWGSISPLGIDCSGLSKILYRFFGIALTNFAAEQVEQGTVLDFLQDARCGDLAFFESADREISHMGVLLSPSEIIHASEIAGKVVIDPIDQEGIMRAGKGIRTHKLRIVKRLVG